MISGDRQEDVRGFHRNLEFVKIIVLKDFRMIERAFDHRLGARLAVFF